MNIESPKYDANFTAGGLLENEFRVLENVLLSENFEEEIQREEINNNIIGIATLSARKRIISEIKRRNVNAPKGFWNHFFQWNQNEKKFGLLYLCFKTYPLVLDIHIEVAIKKFKTGLNMNAYDVQMRLDEIASMDDYVSQWSDSTLEKINVQYRKALSFLGKEIKFCDGKVSSRSGYNNDMNLYQITVPVQPGNSGGPLFDTYGNLVGVINAKFALGDNVSYAIKSSVLFQFINSSGLVKMPTTLSNQSISIVELINNLEDYVVLIKVK